MNFADMLPDGAKAEDLGDGQIGFAQLKNDSKRNIKKHRLFLAGVFV